MRIELSVKLPTATEETQLELMTLWHSTSISLACPSCMGSGAGISIMEFSCGLPPGTLISDQNGWRGQWGSWGILGHCSMPVP